MPIFNCEFPLKVLRDFFKPPSAPDPEFTRFDLKALAVNILRTLGLLSKTLLRESQKNTKRF